jgi:hypothetical protein
MWRLDDETKTAWARLRLSAASKDRIHNDVYQMICKSYIVNEQQYRDFYRNICVSLKDAHKEGFTYVDS